MGSQGSLARRAEGLSRRPKALRFAVLALLWVFPSIGAVWILAINWNVWAKAPTAFEALRTTRVEQWIALALLAVHAVFLFAAFRHRKEKARQG